ncbi:MAG: haloacid dehalogenase-like hydrolase [Verrucomicrobia bacterium]|nr:haloacid dehalogenase-like hydrolase [Verrucomicrobiota bacterium]
MPRHLVVFDLDRTLVRGNSSFDFCKFLVKSDVLPLAALLYSCVCYAQHALFKMPLEELHRKIFESCLQGRSLPALQEQLTPFLASYLPSMLYQPALEKLRLSQHLGHHTLVLSNGPSFLVEKFAEALGVDEWYATEYAVDKEQKLCHIAKVMLGEDKALQLSATAKRLGIDRTEITAYTDSALDLPMLLAAGNPVVVNPRAAFYRLSSKRNWPIL